MTKVVVVGSGGREHALADVISRDADVVITPGNPAIPNSIRTSPLEIDADLYVIGPEAPLVDGLADQLRQQGKLVFGPGADGAQLEGSKAWMKDLVMEAGVPTADHGTFTDVNQAQSYLETMAAPYVIKTDGLAAGKGVLVTNSLDDAKVAVNEYLSGSAFGGAGEKIVIEEGLVGPEISILAISDGKKAVALSPAQDFKRIGEGDTGLNTGGMGCISPSPRENNKNINTVLNKFILPTLKTMNNLGYPFKGILYAGLMFTKKGIYLIEYNVRLGDPECQSIFSRLKSDFLNIALMTEKHKLGKVKIRLDKKKSLCIVMASKGYPEKYKTGFEIQGLNKIKDSSVNIYHAGTTENNKKQTITNGGRVLNIVIREKTLKSAIFKGYSLIKKIKCSNIFFRNDIGS